MLGPLNQEAPETLDVRGAKWKWYSSKEIKTYKENQWKEVKKQMCVNFIYCHNAGIVILYMLLLIFFMNMVSMVISR